MADELSFDVQQPYGLDAVVIAVAGDVDMVSAPQLAACLLDHPDTDMVVDLSFVDFLDSSGINVLVQACKRVRESGHRFCTRAEQDNVLVVISASGLEDHFHADDAPIGVESPGAGASS